jgi:hypothetical protein
MTFEEWYKSYNPYLDPLEDDCLYELKSAYEAGHEEALRVRHELDYLAKLGQEFDNG